jgi:translation initiation factor IF-3
LCALIVVAQEVTQEIVKEIRVNERIRAKEVRVVGESGEQLGIMPLFQAWDMAKRSNLDLVEVAATAVPPVCRILDYGKFKYEQTKKDKESKKGQKVSLLREIRLRPKIGVHDFDAKLRSIKKLLDEGSKVRVTIMFRGREITHSDLGMKILQRVVDGIKEVAVIEKQPLIEDRRLMMILAPSSVHKTAAKAKEEVKQVNAQA